MVCSSAVPGPPGGGLLAENFCQQDHSANLEIVSFKKNPCIFVCLKFVFLVMLLAFAIPQKKHAHHVNCFLCFFVCLFVCLFIFPINTSFWDFFFSSFDRDFLLWHFRFFRSKFAFLAFSSFSIKSCFFGDYFLFRSRF